MLLPSSAAIAATSSAVKRRTTVQFMHIQTIVVDDAVAIIMNQNLTSSPLHLLWCTNAEEPQPVAHPYADTAVGRSVTARALASSSNEREEVTVEAVLLCDEQPVPGL